MIPLVRNITSCIVFVALLMSNLLSANYKNLLKDPDYQCYQIDSNRTFFYKKPGGFDFITNLPKDYVDFYYDTFSGEYLFDIGIITLSTAVMIVYDQPMIDAVQKVGRQWRIGNGDGTSTMLKIGDLPVFRGPTDIGSAMYFIGDGWTHLGLGVSFLTYGLINNDNRALQTASQIAEGMLTTGLATQVLKHITGRESPFVATCDAGCWDLFPNQIEYHKKVPHYDAFPSGHLTTAMMTFTVIAENYPEYKYIRPLGYSLMTILSLQMMNNGVHWISDYPLAIGMGYLLGKAAVNRGRVEVKNNKNDIDTAWYKKISLNLAMNPFQGVSLGLRYKF